MKKKKIPKKIKKTLKNPSFIDVPKDEFDFQIEADIEAERAFYLDEFIKEQNARL